MSEKAVEQHMSNDARTIGRIIDHATRAAVIAAVDSARQRGTVVDPETINVAANTALLSAIGNGVLVLAQDAEERMQYGYKTQGWNDPRLEALRAEGAAILERRRTGDDDE